ncbi:Endonuclease/exonuclease/phosphatase [Mycena galericulata]|nr:Endonuclease/exonuclease/phosphatase [Mycena galericulata]
MRILTWNINGVRTIPQYHPWNTMKTHDDILNFLQADIICFQEMKTTRQNLPKAVGVPPSYHSFFSFPLQKNGYSGVAVYARTEAVLPLKAEEGLTGLLQPKPPLSAAERVSVRDAYPDEIMADDAPDLDFRDLDSEGRALVVDFGLFVLVNVYCPNDGTETEERLQYKIRFHRMLEARVKGLVEVEKREVIVVGDLNACAAVVDHCEGHLMVTRGQAEGMVGEDGFWERDVRRWLRDWLISDDVDNKGCLVDVVRRFWPDRKGMYTCWNTKISARDSNYGTRIDYILITPGLLPWVKAADIQPEIKGSDHCPVFIDLHEQIVDAHGATVRLRDVLRPGAVGAEPPRIAAKFWDEYKQRLLDAFFGRKTDLPTAKLVAPPAQPPKSPSTSDSATSLTSQLPRAPEVEDARTTPPPSPSKTSNAILNGSDGDRTIPLPASQPPERPVPSTTASSVKRKSSTQEPVSSSSKKQKNKTTNIDPKKPKKAGQTSLASFFSKPQTSVQAATTSSSSLADDDMLDADYKLALSLSQEEESRTSSGSSSSKSKSKQAWTTLLAPIQPPKCTVHGEPAKEFTVNKPGPNKGKNFFICARPVGPGYDRGKAERLREEVDPQWRCDFFKWSSEVRLEMTRKSSASAGGFG